jgi:xanthosine utilization system XapX-like protein
MVALSVPALRRPMRRDPANVSVVAVGATTLVGLVWTLQVYSGWPDVFVLLPLAAIGIGGLAGEVTARLTRRTAVAATLTWVVAAVTVAGAYSVTERHHELDLQSDSVDAVLGELPPDASMLSIEAPQPLVLTGATNPTQYQMFVSGLYRYVDDIWPGGLAGFAEWVGRQRPTVIAVGRYEVPYWLEDTMARSYRRVGAAPNWVWYVHRSVGPAVLSDLRARLPNQPLLESGW